MKPDWIDYISFAILAAMFIYGIWPRKYDY